MTRVSPHAAGALHRRSHPASDGPNMILLLFGLALVVGVLVGLGARSWTRQFEDWPTANRHGGNHDGTALSREAADLGYRSEQDFIADRDRATDALLHVLYAAPNTQRLWENPETGNRGLFWASAETVGAAGAHCRNLERRTLINNAFRNAAGTACRTVRGDWDGRVQWQNQ